MPASLDTPRMLEAVAQARMGEGTTRPNPPVGAVIYHGRKQVGEGFHHRAGGPHAEVHALRQAGPGGRGATLYVTLEPCSTTGRTGACTEAILAAGIRRVVVGAVDPNPAHAGRGLRMLRAAGIEVRTGIARATCRELIAPFETRIRTGRPYVTLKLGISLDGRIADRQGHSKWITGPLSRERVQDLRRRCDAILVGAGTLRADNPSLLPRPALGRKPIRVILAGRTPAPTRLKVFTDRAASRTLVAVPASMQRRWAGHPCEILPVAEVEAGRVDIRALLAALGRRGLLHVLCEGGGKIAESLIRAQAVDAYEFVIAPCIIGGAGSCPSVSGKGWLLEDRPRLQIMHTRRVGNDVWIQAKPEKE